MVPTHPPGQTTASEGPTAAGGPTAETGAWPARFAPRVAWSVIGVLVVCLASYAAWLWGRGDAVPGGMRSGGIGSGGAVAADSRWRVDLSAASQINPDSIGYEQVGALPVSGEGVLHGLAVDSAGHIGVAYDHGVDVLDARGAVQQRWTLPVEPWCLAWHGRMDAEATVSGGQNLEDLCVASSGGIQLLAAGQQQPSATWPLPADGAQLTSMAFAGAELLVADVVHRVIWRYAEDGTVAGQIGAPDDQRDIPGFVIPSAYFDIVVGRNGLVWAVDPGRLRIVEFTLSGEMGRSWGRAGAGLDRFFGCCNPAHIGLLSDGRFVTSEKGIPRIKIFARDGSLETVVAGPAQLGIAPAAIGDPRLPAGDLAFEIAVLPQDRIAVLDAANRLIRIFAPREDVP